MGKLKGETSSESTEPFVEPVYQTSVESIDVDNQIVLLKTNAPEGTEIGCNVSGEIYSGPVVDGLVWIRLAKPLGATYTITVL